MGFLECVFYIIRVCSVLHPVFFWSRSRETCVKKNIKIFSAKCSVPRFFGNFCFWVHVDLWIHRYIGLGDGSDLERKKKFHNFCKNEHSLSAFYPLFPNLCPWKWIRNCWRWFEGQLGTETLVLGMQKSPINQPPPPPSPSSSCEISDQYISFIIWRWAGLVTALPPSHILTQECF